MTGGTIARKAVGPELDAAYATVIAALTDERERIAQATRSAVAAIEFTVRGQKRIARTEAKRWQARLLGVDRQLDDLARQRALARAAWASQQAGGQ